MAQRDFASILGGNFEKGRFICVGLDSDAAKLPKGQTQLSFNQAIIEATCDLVGAYKPNSAFYESQGSQGWETLKKTIAFIYEKAPQALVILDAKRSDIGNTSAAYACAAFEDLQVDAITLHPYLGQEAIQPFLNYKNKGSFILCRTSNPGAKEFQDLIVDGEPLYLKIARQVAMYWNKNQNCGLVVGATYPSELKKIREVAKDLPFLVPGVGAQGGDLEAVLKNGRQGSGNGLLINLSRSVIFASPSSDFAQKARGILLKIIKNS